MIQRVYTGFSPIISEIVVVFYLDTLLGVLYSRVQSFPWVSRGFAWSCSGPGVHRMHLLDRILKSLT